MSAYTRDHRSPEYLEMVEMYTTLHQEGVGSEKKKDSKRSAYDPGYEPFSQLPAGQFDGVICIDVLEHITEPDLGWVIDELFAHAHRFVFATIAYYSAKKHLPNDQNAHCTVRPPPWWTGLIHGIAMRHTDVSYRFHLVTRTGPRKKLGGLCGKRTLEEQTIECWA